MEYLKELNDLQLKAVTTQSKKVLVVAGAGSGKTKVLTDRVKYLIDNGVNKNQILTFTFTKKAAKEMKDRLKDYNFDNVFTFHSFCYQYIMSNPKQFGINKDDIYVMLDDYKERLVSNIIEDMNLKINKTKILQYISKRKNGIDVTFDKSEDECLYNAIYYRYQEYINNCGAIDFDDMVPLFLNHFNNMQEKDIILRNAKYILVDECQDTNKLQYDLVQLLSQLHGNVFMVGDEKQLIYSFRSSDIKIINDFKDSCDEVIELKQNYRSASNILATANKLISNNRSTFDNDIFSLIPPKYNVTKQLFKSTIEEAYIVSLTIEKLIKSGVNPKDIAILYRNNYQSSQFELALKNRHIDYVVYGKNPFNQTPECKKVISAYRFLKNPTDYLLFLLLLPIKKEEMEIFQKGYINKQESIIEYAKRCPNEKIKSIANKLMELKINKYQFNKADTFEIIKEILFGDDLKTHQSENLRLLKDIIVASELSDECEILNEIALDEVTPEHPKGVRLMTIHKAKGLEFKCVFLVSLNDGILPAINIKLDALEEERRLCYVALTRAKEFLHVSSAYEHYISGVKKILRPSVFMNEIKAA